MREVMAPVGFILFLAGAWLSFPGASVSAAGQGPTLEERQVRALESIDRSLKEMKRCR